MHLPCHQTERHTYTLAWTLCVRNQRRRARRRGEEVGGELKGQAGEKVGGGGRGRGTDTDRQTESSWSLSSRQPHGSPWDEREREGGRERERDGEREGGTERELRTLLRKD